MSLSVVTTIPSRVLSDLTQHYLNPNAALLISQKFQWLNHYYYYLKKVGSARLRESGIPTYRQKEEKGKKIEDYSRDKAAMIHDMLTQKVTPLS